MGTSLVEWYKRHVLHVPPKTPKNGSDADSAYDQNTDAFYLEMEDIRKAAISKARTHHKMALEENQSRRNRGNPIADAAFPPRHHRGDA